MKQNDRGLELLITEKHAGQWLFSVLKSEFQASKPVITEWMNQKSIQVNRTSPKNNIILKTGDRLFIDLQEKTGSSVIPEYGEPDILFEDRHMLIANKPAGMPTHPNEEGQTGTLSNLIAYHFQINGEQAKVRHVHRLDRDTSGAVVFAKHRLAHAILDRQLETKTLKRTYIAAAEGKVTPKKGTVDSPIGRDRSHSVRRRVSPGGQAAVTHYKVKGYHPGAQLTLAELELETGRTHQIRVHMASIGHPLAGDDLYGGSRALFHRQALHAKKVSVVHPISGEEIVAEAPMPADLAHFTETYFS
ncbi:MULTISPECIES: RluA family pseudouridine synthase [Bacillus amyloliquefaciens group]|uniref:RluA family pseudouridine synthase n=1 Tax=Bacillus amyloliquefaciens group TaxID=1938374 RepID=UPI0014196E24|nr:MULTISPECIES: RluA family pseudouridine synthase [Bacillus amyloliquefaciens group]MBI0444289.1 RluA family pseudouridine synthase [Bacillus velezensis]NIH00604.1 RluA family pseudouridine synthase [Bacillus amyloliquefaciens]QIW83136.1 RluA family pseudouridine synthase [Bacillus velezensis]QUI65903.1 RluA family pseudouridine synthase [Bacillus velezensis]UYP23754.1 RluA family pseudouridine synthase [Bacillus velezensis]